MKGYLYEAGGGTYELPELLSWRFTYTDGSSADAFEIECPYDGRMEHLLRGAYRFRAVDEKGNVFYGVVDECAATAGKSGSRLTVAGRGLAALLMDNEAEAVEYEMCSVEDILRDHVRPVGVTDIRCGGLSSLPAFTVSRGDSEWEVLSQFIRFAGGGVPRFDRSGTLLIGQGPGDMVTITDWSGVTDVEIREKRYGVISEAVVKGNTNGMRSVVANGEFIARGGQCRRVVYVPNTAGYDTMRYTGGYQIERSQEDASLLLLEVSEPFYAFGGERAAVTLSSMGIDGRYAVREAVSWADSGGAGTRLTLVPEAG